MSPNMRTLSRFKFRPARAVTLTLLVASVLAGCQGAPGADGRYASGPPSAGPGRWAP